LGGVLGDEKKLPIEMGPSPREPVDFKALRLGVDSYKSSIWLLISSSSSNLASDNSHQDFFPSVGNVSFRNLEARYIAADAISWGLYCRHKFVLKLSFTKFQAT
jgi:hypothetical protein